eukprot:Nk52_evm51s164 gene=Nk52_evmTU51s164
MNTVQNIPAQSHAQDAAMHDTEMPATTRNYSLRVRDDNAVLMSECTGSTDRDFQVAMVPRYHWTDARAVALLKEEKPVILVGTNLSQTAVDRWDVGYLEENVGQGDFDVLESDSLNFPTYDETKTRGIEEFTPPTKRLQMGFTQFLDKLSEGGDKKYYLQQVLNDTIGPNVVKDFLGFNWKWLSMIQQKLGWGQLVSNTLLVGAQGVVTPCHYDEYHNLLAQVKGKKRFLLFGPDNFKNLYPYPVHHPCDRQSRVDFEHPNYSKFPLFKDARAAEAVIGPGDVLYIPMYWFHHVVALSDNISVNFLCKPGPTPERIAYPLTSSQKLAIRRNIEKMLRQALGNPNEVGEFLHDLVDGRF